MLSSHADHVCFSHRCLQDSLEALKMDAVDLVRSPPLEPAWGAKRERGKLIASRTRQQVLPARPRP
jgi:hypothetical protein